MLPPDINESELRFTVTPQGVRFGLTAIKNVGEGAIESILDVRQADGPDPVASGSVRRSRPAPGQQARSRGAGEGRRAGFAGAAVPPAELAAAAARAAAATDGGARRGRGSRRARPARSGVRSGRAVWRRRRRVTRSTARTAASRGAGVERHRAAQRRKGSRRPLLDRPSHRRARGRPRASSAPARSPNSRTTNEDDERRAEDDE